MVKRQRSIRQRVILLLTVTIIAMAALDLLAAHFLLQRSLRTYSIHREQDQAVDWAQIISIIYDEHRSWSWFTRRLEQTSSIHIDGKSLSQVDAAIRTSQGQMIFTHSRAAISPHWQIAPILSNNRRPIGTLYMDGYVPPKVVLLTQRITFYSDLAQFFILLIMVFITIAAAKVVIRNVLFPLEKLAGAAQSITDGNYDADLPDEGDTEVQNVVNAFLMVRSKLDEARKAREKILADIHHELRTPLTIIANRLEAIYLGIYFWDEQTATVLHSETARMQRILNELRQVDDPPSEPMQLHRDWITVQEWLPGIVYLFRAETVTHGITLNVDLPQEPLKVWIDKDRISQVIINLLTNAIRFTPAGRSILLEVKDTKNGTAWSVKDEGAGIATEHLPEIFNRFFRGNAAGSSITGGAGLGLAIVKEIVNGHGGEVTASSEADQGTCITFFLPTP